MSIEPSNQYALTVLQCGRTVGRFKPLSRIDGLVHCVTTKRGELFPPIASEGADAFKRLACDMQMPAVAWAEQVHDNTVLAVDSAGCAGQADGLVTATPGLLLLGRSADCPLILAADPVRKIAGFAHASWRATIKKITVRLIDVFRELGSNPNDIVACICPSAGPEKFEVGPEVFRQAVAELGPDAKNFFLAGKGDKKFFDLWAANDSQLQSAGVDFMNVYSARVCTISNVETYPSYRVEGSAAQRFAATIGWKN
ncbi:MAG TPA: polyphenol oxidase family protein [Phycisphaerae bacterium]|nr:polyphenol oxidase family protein [Phycisphaerae bacterium]HPS52457.1 polyphenol oxidase family protein [Phycisphaerae bacterium]